MLVAVAVAVVVGVVFRFVAGTPMWLDEALTVNIAELPPSQMLDALRADGHPPLYYLLLNGWMQVFGTSDTAIRALSGVFSVASLPLVWLVGRRIGGTALAWIATAALAMSPFAVRYATENRMYALAGFLVLVGWLLVDDLWRRTSAWRVVALAVVGGALLLTHYWALFLIGAVGLVAVVRWWQTSGAERAAAGWLIVGLAASGVVFAPWVPSFLQQLSSTGTPWASPSRPSAAVGLFLGDLSGGLPPEAMVVVAVSGILLALALFGQRTGDAGRIELVVRGVPTVRTEAVVVALTLVVGTVVGFVGATAFATRYAMVVAPVVVVVLAVGVAVVDHRVARIVLLGALLAGGVAGIGQELDGNRSQMNLVAAGIASQAVAGDVVVYCPDQLGPSGDRALRAELGDDVGGLTQVVVPTLTGPEFVDWVDYADRNAAIVPSEVVDGIVSLAGPDASVFLVWNGSYRTYEGVCEEVIDLLAPRYPSVTEVVAADPDNHFEHAAVLRFGR
jgi:mannosyltransferase